MNFDIEILADGVWQLASSHSQSDDRDAQYQRFIDSGIPAENLRLK